MSFTSTYYPVCVSQSKWPLETHSTYMYVCVKRTSICNTAYTDWLNKDKTHTIISARVKCIYTYIEFLVGNTKDQVGTEQSSHTPIVLHKAYRGSCFLFAVNSA